MRWLMVRQNELVLKDIESITEQEYVQNVLLHIRLVFSNTAKGGSLSPLDSPNAKLYAIMMDRR